MTDEGKKDRWRRWLAEGKEAERRWAQEYGHDGSSVARGPDATTTPRARHEMFDGSYCPVIGCRSWVPRGKEAEHGRIHRENPPPPPSRIW